MKNTAKRTRYTEHGELDPRVEDQLHEKYGWDGEIEWQEDIVFAGDHYVLLTVNPSKLIVIKEDDGSSSFVHTVNDKNTNAFWSALVVASLVEGTYPSSVKTIVKPSRDGVTLKVIGGWSNEPAQLQKRLNALPDTSAELSRNGASFLDIRNPKLWESSRPSTHREDGVSILTFK
jgi:hypothetical protein